LDIAYARTQIGDLAAGAAVLLDLGNTAPTWLRHQRYALDIVQTIRSGRRRGLSRDVAALAALVGLDS
jgi:hypothetical protein